MHHACDQAILGVHAPAEAAKKSAPSRSSAPTHTCGHARVVELDWLARCALSGDPNAKRYTCALRPRSQTAEFHLFGKTGPYAVLRVGDKSAQTRPALLAEGSSPRWHETFDFDIREESMLEIT